MSNETMLAIRFHEYGGPGQLVLERVPRPEPGPGTVLVRVVAAGVNPVDWKVRNGTLSRFMPLDLPSVPGRDLAGVVEALGPGVSGFQTGQAVYGQSATGSYAEYALAPTSTLVPKPANLTFAEAAATPIGAGTAWRGLFEVADLRRGQRILIQGAAGGVGSFAVQMARWQGAHVIGTASTANQDFVKSLGADETIDYQKTRFESAVHDVDVVFDTVGGEVLERSWPVLRPGGILVSIAGQASPEQAQAHGVRAGSPGRADPAQIGEVLRRIDELLGAGQLQAKVMTTFPLAAAAEAHRLSETGHGQGRIVLHVAD